MTHGQYATPPATRAGKTSVPLVVGLVLGMILLAGGVMLALVKFVGTGNPPPAATDPADAGRTAVVLPGPAVSAAASDVLVLFKDKQAEAEGKYNGKVLDVTGTVFATSTNLAGERAVTLEGGSQARFAGVRCVFPAANYFQLDGVENGQTVTIRGRCEGAVSDVVLRDSAVLTPAK